VFVLKSDLKVEDKKNRFPRFLQ